MAVTGNFRIDCEIALTDLATGEMYHFDYIKQKTPLELAEHGGPDIISTMAVIATEGRSIYIKENPEKDDDA